jgi:putative ABC transport system ATP-binding protein
MKILEINNVKKFYSENGLEVKAVNGVSLTVNIGEFMAVVGPSGSGKTTLLNLIGGLDAPTSGEIFIDGHPIHAMKKGELTDFRLRNIGFVFQAYNLIPVLTAGENVEFVMKLLGYSQKDCDKRTRELLDAVGLADRINSRPGKLSGGQQQRVAVARSLASKPKFVLADEPTANLDSHAAEILLEIMENLNKNEGITFIFSTHDPRIMKRAKRIVSLEDGLVFSDVCQ